MRANPLTGAEQRVLGCLIEKRFTTPDTYPLSLNALRLACNQSTNRDPVTDLDESNVRAAAQSLCRYGLARLASGHTSRAIKYRHLTDEALGLQREALAVLAVLLLRGAQTPGELKARTERMAPLASLDEVEIVLQLLVDRGFVRRLERRPGQKEERFVQLLGEEDAISALPADDRFTGSPSGDAPPVASAPGPSVPVPSAPGSSEPANSASAEAAPTDGVSPDRVSPDGVSPDFAPPDGGPPVGPLSTRVSALEAQVAALQAQLAALRSAVPIRPGT